MTDDQCIDLLYTALDHQEGPFFEAFMNVMDQRRYVIESDGDGIWTIHNNQGARVYHRENDDARDFWRHISFETGRALKLEFIGMTKRKPRVIVGKARLIPFPDRKLAPAPAP